MSKLSKEDIQCWDDETYVADCLNQWTEDIKSINEALESTEYDD